MVDTNFLIDCLRKKVRIKLLLERYPDEMLFTTEINVFELYLGLYSSKILANNPILFERRRRQLEELLTKFQILPFTRRDAIETSRLLGKKLRNEKKVNLRDGLIAGIAYSNGFKRKTDDLYFSHQEIEYE